MTISHPSASAPSIAAPAAEDPHREGISDLLIRPLRQSDLPQAAQAASEAFLSSELYAWVAGGEGDLRGILPAVFGYRLALGASYGETMVAEERGRVIGAAVWLPPTTNLPAYQAAKEALAALGTMRGSVAGLPEGVQRRWLGFFDIFQKARDAVVRQPYWALAPIFVRPERQGLKVGSRLLRSRFRALDEAGESCFLGTQDEFSRDVYLGYGFEIVRGDPIMDSGLATLSAGPNSRR